MIQSIVRLSAVMLLAATISACGSKAPRPISELALASSALKNAETSGAREYAPIELRIARDKTEAAEGAMADEKYAKAHRLTQEASADADLARAKANVEKSRLALKEAKDNIEMIRSEATRTSMSK
jgi:predicted component of type VI protein secretion system